MVKVVSIVLILLLCGCTPKVDYFGIGPQPPALRGFLEEYRDAKLNHHKGDSLQVLIDIRILQAQLNDTILQRIEEHYVEKENYRRRYWALGY